MDTNNRTVVVSGGFDPLHIGHIRMFQEAHKLGDRLVVILNNDNWLIDKKGFSFMPEQERKELIEAYDFVDEVVITSHTLGCEDRSVCSEIRDIHPSIFANGGDRQSDNTPEVALCGELGIELAFNVGGGKIQSSSWLTDKIHKIISRPWGTMETLEGTENWWIKVIKVNAEESLSLQSHRLRSEIWACVDGTGTANVGGTIHNLVRGSLVWFAPGVIHQLSSQTGCTVVEIAHGENLSEDDIRRYEDKYGRI